MRNRVSVHQYAAAAAGVLDPTWLGYFAGGAADEITLRENRAAFDRLALLPRVLRDVSSTSTAATVLGYEVSMPLVVAPVAYQRKAHVDGELGMARAAAAAGTAMCLSTLATASPAEVRAAAPGAVLFHQLYVFRDRGATDALVAEALDAGFSAIFLTVDLPVVGKRERELAAGWELPIEEIHAFRLVGDGSAGLGWIDSSIDWSYLARLCSAVPVPVVVKGVLSAEDAVLAAEHGAAGVVVSNHGGRQLDGARATIESLPEVVAAVDDRLEVFLDGGVCRGTDIAKALAVGSKGVLAGRAPLWGLAVDGEAGAHAVLDILRDELALALGLLGCRSVDELTPKHVVDRTRSCVRELR